MCAFAGAVHTDPEFERIGPLSRHEGRRSGHQACGRVLANHKQIAVDKAAVTAKQEEYRSPIRTEERVPRGSHARSVELLRGTLRQTRLSVRG